MVKGQSLLLLQWIDFSETFQAKRQNVEPRSLVIVYKCILFPMQYHHMHNKPWHLSITYTNMLSSVHILESWKQIQF